MKLIGNQSKEYLLESCNQSQYCWGVLNKTHKIYKGLTNICDDVFSLFNSRLQCMQFQATLPPPPELTLLSKNYTIISLPMTCNKSYTDASYLKHTFSSFKGIINASPLVQISKKACLVKKTFDFGIASVQWITGNRSNQSMLHNTINTALSYMPFMLAYTSFGETLPGQVLGNAILIGCLAYSVRQDFFKSIDRSKRESSPTVDLTKRFILPKIQNIFSKVWG